MVWTAVSPRTVIPNPIVNDRCLLWNVKGGILTDCLTVEPVEELSYVRFPGPARCTSRARALVHSESTLQPAIASAGRQEPSRRKQ